VVAPPGEAAPEVGHGSFRVTAGAGLSSTDGGLAVLDLRLALHDLGDPPAGFPPLSQLEFLPMRLRLAPRESRAELDEAWLVRILSLNDVTRFDLRPSWRVKAGAATVRDGGCDRCLAAQAELGAGFTKAALLGALDLYAGLDAAVEWSPRLAGLAGSEVRAGIGPGGLVRLRAGRVASLVADARWRYLPDAEQDRTWDLRAALRVHLAPGISLSLEARRTPAQDEGIVAALGYF
jgi:hypothetical protein